MRRPSSRYAEPSTDLAPTTPLDVSQIRRALPPLRPGTTPVDGPLPPPPGEAVVRLLGSPIPQHDVDLPEGGETPMMTRLFVTVRTPSRATLRRSLVWAVVSLGIVVSGFGVLALAVR